MKSKLSSGRKRKWFGDSPPLIVRLRVFPASFPLPRLHLHPLSPCNQNRKCPLSSTMAHYPPQRRSPALSTAFAGALRRSGA